MDNPPNPPAPAEKPKKDLAFKIFGVGNAGMNIIERMMDAGPAQSAFVAVNTDAVRLADSTALERVHLETRFLRGLGSGGDPDRGRSLAEEQAERFKTLCQGQDLVFLVAGLGGGAGSGITPVIARLAKEAGALVLVFVTLPFDCEGNRRRGVANEALQELREVADAVICLPDQRVFSLLEESTTVAEAFRFTGDLLADCARSIWRLLTHAGLIEIHLSDLCELLRDDHADCSFAVAEASGATRSREVLDKLMAHPLLEGGECLSDSEGVLVSLMGGPDLTMTEIDRIMQEFNTRCGQARVIMGAVIHEAFQERLALTVIAVRKMPEAVPQFVAPRMSADGLDRQLLKDSVGPRPGSRFVPPAPSLPPEQVQQMLAQQRTSRSSGRKGTPRFRQANLPLEIVSKGRFDKSEPTIHKGEDLDVPTYIRQGVSLN
jgi:cell division protein FtsZ